MADGVIKLKASVAFRRSYSVSHWWDSTRKEKRKKRKYNKNTWYGLILQRLKQSGAEIISVRVNETKNTLIIKYNGNST